MYFKEASKLADEISLMCNSKPTAQIEDKDFQTNYKRSHHL